MGSYMDSLLYCTLATMFANFDILICKKFNLLDFLLFLSQKGITFAGKVYFIRQWT